MGEILLVTRPKFDDATEYLSYYASLILKEADNLRIEKKDFSGKEVTSKNISKFIEKKNPKLIFVNGHGDPNSLEGDEGEIIFSVQKNVHLLKDKLLYARACNAGLIFGKEMVKNNGGCFIGYNTPFTFWIDGKYSAIPAKDTLASLFLMPSNEIVNSLIKGHSAKSSNEKSKKMMIENMKKILQMEEKNEPGAMGWLGALWNNYEGQVVHGNEEMYF
ncbi:hypothetical protein COU57_01890 [Candidatus Pacearchaeota archaeon CG10_big_fil_rev_8_21_14_0_10_32_14]|nr:MAG: hypothetical protein COU57_01890 [Candidatus Pacearchaeota archaeon CG10_big_fil_rev_8_21_14_0_10_32_14]